MNLEHDTIVETAIERRNMLSLLGTVQLFRGLDASTLAAIAAEIEWFSLPGRPYLFEAGDPPDALYFVISGCLGAFARTPDGHTRLVGPRHGGRDGRRDGAHLGQAAHGQRACACATREIGRFSKQAFDALLLDHPQAMLRIAQLTVRDSRARSASSAASARCPKTFTLLPQGPTSTCVLRDAARRGARIRRALRARLERARPEHTSHWFDNVESANDFVIYVADPGADPVEQAVRAPGRCAAAARPCRRGTDWPVLEGGANRDSPCSAPNSCCCRNRASCPGRRIAGSPSSRGSRIITCARRRTSHVSRAC